MSGFRAERYRDTRGPGCEGVRRLLAVLSEPRTVWWVQVRNRRGEVGWTSQPEAFGG